MVSRGKQYMHGEIQKKTNEHICAFFTAAGTVEFSKKIPAPNHLCRTTQLYIEQFLRVILIWDPKNRGGGIEKESKRPKCFVLLDNIFKMKVIHFLCVTTNQLLSYPVTENHKLLDVMNVIEQETRIPVAEQEILFASGIVPDINQPAVQCWDEQGEDESIVFLFHKKITDFSNSSSSTTRRKAKPIPDLVQVMIAEPKTLMPYQDQKKTWGHAVYFCMEQAKDYKRLLQAQRAAMLNLLRNNSIFTKLKTQMTTEITKLMAKIDFSKESITQDIERYEEQERSGGLSSEKLKKSWTMMKEEIMKYTKLQQQVNDLEVHTQGLQTKIVELQRSPYARTKQTDTLGEIEAAAMKLYQELRQMAREKRQQISDNTGMVQAVVRCYTQRDKLTGDLYQHISKLASCKLDMSDLLPRVQETIDDIKAGSSVLMAYQKQRQTEMWTMLKKLVQRSQAPGSQPHSLTSSLMRSTSRQSGSSGGNSFSQMFEKNMEASSMLRTENEDSKTKLESTLSSLVLEQEEFLSADNQLQWDFLAEEEAPSIQQGADLS
ncbi:inhibitor of nuclear factor kappa-B kinase subunit alpha [Lingula anatina]|uniref:Inhibitor of nuclear factor kappa-B kinase subunit alpha n=1 Tax=Lingula anatina TaxID=7574 RepID=A0A1S3J720_LINAN|nr:inhibitor of nuclear factor kappa-B kinase subunit alpha [Lingula anatina]|eukprot:XP_013406195.1 inhibitor of nuclear factor kappa-B kinase subunit alpha [Lingula anatina]